MVDDKIKADGREARLSGPQRLKHREESAVRNQMMADARDACNETRAAYVACAKGETAPRLQ